MKKININISKNPLRTFLRSLGLFCILVVIYVLAANSVSIQSQAAQETFELFGLIGTSKDHSLASIAGVKEQEIKINLDNQNFEEVKKMGLPLLDGKIYEAVRSQSEGFLRFADNEFTWRGKIFGDNDWIGDVTLTVKDKALSGLIYSPSGVYEIIPQENFKHILVEIDQSRFPDCGGGISIDDIKTEKTGNTNFLETPFNFNRSSKELFGEMKNSSPMSNSSQNSLVVDDGSTIDVLIVYTAAVRNALGGTTQTQAFAQQAIASTNTVYQNSQILTRLRLVQAMEVNYTDNGTGLDGLNWVRTDATVANARNSFRADLVALLTENANDVCGIGYLMGNVSSSFEPYGFSLTQRICAVGGLTFAHELGHNQGADHNPENATSGSHAYPYAFGHWSSGAAFRTVMSYSNPCPSCVRIPYFSNPLLTYNGFPLGIANARDNARVINNTALTVSRFRDSSGGGTCPSATISPGQTISGSLTTSDCVYTGTSRYVDIYTFNGNAGQMISISMNSTAFDTRLYLVNSANQIIAQDDDGGGGTNSRIPAGSGFFTLPTDGNYSIQATSFSENTTGAYSLNLAVNSSCVSSSISFGQTVNGTLAASDCINSGKYYDEYTFTGSAGQQITVSQSSAVFDTFLYLLNSSGQIIAQDDDGGGGTNSRIPAGSGFFSLPASGTYTIRASSFAVGATGAYSVNLASASAGALQFSSPTFTVNENAGTATITVLRTGGSSGAVSVNYATSNGTATAGQDYSSASGTLNFANGITSQSFTVSIINDLVVEGNETINLTLSNPTGGSVIGTPGTAILNIVDDDICTYSVNQTGITVPEVPASGGTLSFSVTTPNGCNWSAFSNVSWIIVTSGSSGSGNGTVTLTFTSNTGAFRFGGVIIAGQSFNFLQQSSQPSGKKHFDFDGDGKTDYGVFRPLNGAWYLQNSTNGFLGTAFGISTDKITPADYDGDGKSDIAVFRNGIWHLLKSSEGYAGIQFGQAGDIPLPADYDGDGKADIAVFRAGVWHILRSRDGYTGVQFGIAADKPAAADYDGDGRADIAVVRQANGLSIWYILGSSHGYFGVEFGTNTDRLVPADYDGDGKADVAVYRNGIWHILRSRDGYTGVSFGTAEDKPVPGDYDGDGRADIAVWRPSSGVFHILQSQNGYTGLQFGQNGDMPVASAFVP